MTFTESEKVEAIKVSSRVSLSKKLRFEVFKRDSFTCQYCGQRAPAVVLHCDHIKPVAEGGTTDILNLVTSCQDCNLGKGARTLSENAVVAKQLKQLTTLQEKREQMEMMLAWRDELNQIDEVPLLELEKRWNVMTEGQYWFSDDGKKTVKKLIKRYGFDEVVTAMTTAADQYLEKDDSGTVTCESVELAFDYIGRIANVERRERLEPGSKKIFYIRGIVRNRLSYCPDWKALALIKEAAQAGMPLEAIEQIARQTTSWSRFKADLEDYVEEVRRQEEQHERWRSWMFDELTKLFGARHAGVALSKISSAMSLGISQEYLLDIARYGTGTAPDWTKYERWLDWIGKQWNCLICPLQDILKVSFPPQKACDVFCLIEDFHYSLESIKTTAKQLGTWARFELWLDETFSVALEADMKASGIDLDTITIEVRDADTTKAP